MGTPPVLLPMQMAKEYTTAKDKPLFPPPTRSGISRAMGPGMQGQTYPRYRTAEAMEFAVDAYFERLQVEGKPPTMAGLALSLGFRSAKSLKQYEEKGDDYASVVEIARTQVEEWKNELLLQGGQQTNGIIFDLKNNHGWSDKTENKVTHSTDGSLLSLLQELQGTVLRPVIEAQADDAEFRNYPSVDDLI